MGGGANEGVVAAGRLPGVVGDRLFSPLRPFSFCFFLLFRFFRSFPLSLDEELEELELEELSRFL